MGLRVEADEFQWVVEDAVRISLPLADAAAGFDLPRGRFSAQRKGDEAPAIAVKGGLICPVPSIQVLGGGPALAPGILALPENSPPSAVPLHPHPNSVRLAWNRQWLLQSHCRVLADGVWHFAFALKLQFEARAFLAV